MALTNSIPKILESLQQRRAALDAAIAALQALASTEGPRRGRRPKALAAIEPATEKPRRRLSEETRRKMSEAAKRRAERRKAEKGG